LNPGTESDMQSLEFEDLWDNEGLGLRGFCVA
jgi:hypothetical protein